METNPIQEANRYLANARQILSEKAKKDGDSYSDAKYVKIAGHTAWCGVLIALDAVLNVRKNLKKNQRPDFDDYRTALYKKDPKMNRDILNAYDSLHKSLGYDGILDYKIVQRSLELAKIMVDWASLHYNPETPATPTLPRRSSFLSTLKFW
jgi:hypothetical protein